MGDNIFYGFNNAATPINVVDMGGGWKKYEVTGQDGVPYAHAQIDLPKPSQVVVVVQNNEAPATPASVEATPPPPPSSAPAAPVAPASETQQPCAAPRMDPYFARCVGLLGAMLAELGPCALADVRRRLMRSREYSCDLRRLFEQVALDEAQRRRDDPTASGRSMNGVSVSYKKW